MDLTDEQRRRMEESRRKAQDRLRERRRLQSISSSETNRADAALGPRRSRHGSAETDAARGHAGGDVSPRSKAGKTILSEGSATNDTVGAVSNIRIQRGDDGDNPEVVSDTAGMERELVDGTPRNKLWRTDEEETVGTRTIAAAPTTEPATDESYRASALTSGTGSRVGGRGGRQGTRAGGGNRTSVGGIGSTRTGDGVRAIVVAPPTCEVCERKDGDVRVDKELLEGFGVSVCWGCKLTREEYQCVPKKEAKEGYLLPEGTIAVLKYIERDNPHHSSWTKMKLFLRRHVMEYSYQRWGGEDGLVQERARRDALKFEKSLARTKGVFKRSRTTLASRERL